MSTTPETRRPLPRFTRNLRNERADAYVAALPPAFTELLLAAGVPEASQHRDVSARYVAATERVRELVTEHAKVEQADEARVREALRTGKAKPAPKAAKLADELELARKDAATLASLTIEAAEDLLRASIPHLSDATDQADKQVDADTAECLTLARGALDALNRAMTVANERAWLSELTLDGTVAPFAAGRRAEVLPKLRQLLIAVEPAYAEDVARREEQAEARERREASALPAPPGTPVWRPGEADAVVGADGEVVEEPELG
jgi:hypothetical protein